MTVVGRVSGLFRHPVKTMLGEEPESVVLGALGIEGDRTWAVRDHTRGDFSTGERVPALMSCRASSGEGGKPPMIALPEGTTVAADDPKAARWLSDALGRNVSIWPIDPPGELPPELTAQCKHVLQTADAQQYALLYVLQSVIADRELADGRCTVS